MKKTFLDVINKVLLVALFTIITMIVLKSNPDFKEKFYKNIYEKSINFTYFNSLYKKYFDTPVPSVKKTQAVFNEKLDYKSSRKYRDGVELDVGDNYTVPAINNGMVIYKGDMDGYGSVVVIEQVDGVEVMYGNINSNLKMYDYIDKGDIVGESNNKLYLVFKRGDNILNYEDYI